MYLFLQSRKLFCWRYIVLVFTFPGLFCNVCDVIKNPPKLMDWGWAWPEECKKRLEIWWEHSLAAFVCIRPCSGLQFIISVSYCSEVMDTEFPLFVIWSSKDIWFSPFCFIVYHIVLKKEQRSPRVVPAVMAQLKSESWNNSLWKDIWRGQSPTTEGDVLIDKKRVCCLDSDR